MIGMDRVTGKRLEGDAHLVQSIGDILSTPLGTRLARRDYGSLLFELIDAPFNAATRLRLYAATAIALARWEPRIRLSRVAITAGDSIGEAVIQIEGARTDVATPSNFARLTIPLRLVAAA